MRQTNGKTSLPAQLTLMDRARQVPAVPLRKARRRKLQTVGLFAGVGGIELGLKRAGHETSLLCEIEPGAVAVLHKRFPGVPVHEDICTLDALPAGTELITGGFPCQDLSQAGRTAGIEGSRSGLISEVFRLVQGQRVPWVVLENVPFMLQLSRGRALEVILDTLESLGYHWAYRVVDSRAFGRPQRRERVFIVASLDSDPRDVLLVDDIGTPPSAPVEGTACGFYWTEGVRGLGWAVDAVPTLKGGSTIGIPSPPAIVLPTGEVVKPDIRDAERMQGFPVDWTRPAELVLRAGHRWKLVGNAVTVDVAHWIGRRLAVPGRYEGRWDEPLVRRGAWPRAAWNVGGGRHVAAVGAWPKLVAYDPLHQWLRFRPEPLSAKATAGFLSRAKQGSLRFPQGFLETLEAHLGRMQRAAS